MVDGILRHLDARLVVFSDHELGSSLVSRRHDLTKKAMNLLAFLNRQTERDVLCFAR